MQEGEQDVPFVPNLTCKVFRRWIAFFASSGKVAGELNSYEGTVLEAHVTLESLWGCCGQ